MMYRGIRLREQVNKYWYHRDTFDEPKFKPLLKAIHTKVHGRCFATPVEARILEALCLPRLKDLSLEVLRDGRVRGKKFADFQYYNLKKLVSNGQIDEEKALQTAKDFCKLNFIRNNEKYLLSFIKDTQDIQNNLLKKKTTKINCINNMF